jgi:hypothetical protein
MRSVMGSNHAAEELDNPGYIGKKTTEYMDGHRPEVREDDAEVRTRYRNLAIMGVAIGGALWLVAKFMVKEIYQPDSQYQRLQATTHSELHNNTPKDPMHIPPRA